jgi:hypothetical protein
MFYPSGLTVQGWSVDHDDPTQRRIISFVVQEKESRVSKRNSQLNKVSSWKKKYIHTSLVGQQLKHGMDGRRLKASTTWMAVKRHFALDCLGEI